MEARKIKSQIFKIVSDGVRELSSVSSRLHNKYKNGRPALNKKLAQLKKNTAQVKKLKSELSVLYPRITKVHSNVKRLKRDLGSKEVKLSSLAKYLAKIDEYNLEIRKIAQSIKKSDLTTKLGAGLDSVDPWSNDNDLDLEADVHHSSSKQMSGLLDGILKRGRGRGKGGRSVRFTDDDSDDENYNSDDNSFQFSFDSDGDDSDSDNDALDLFGNVRESRGSFSKRRGNQFSGEDSWLNDNYDYGDEFGYGGRESRYGGGRGSRYSDPDWTGGRYGGGYTNRADYSGSFNPRRYSSGPSSSIWPSSSGYSSRYSSNSPYSSNYAPGNWRSTTPSAPPLPSGIDTRWAEKDKFIPSRNPVISSGTKNIVLGRTASPHLEASRIASGSRTQRASTLADALIGSGGSSGGSGFGSTRRRYF